jgi:hypothetical protein
MNITDNNAEFRFISPKFKVKPLDFFSFLKLLIALINDLRKSMPFISTEVFYYYMANAEKFLPTKLSNNRLRKEVPRNQYIQYLFIG